VGTETPRLFTETISVPADDIAIMNTWLASQPQDPDYSTGWPTGVQVSGLEEGATQDTVDLTGPANAPLADDPGLGKDGGRLAIDALLFNGGFQQGESVDFTYNGQPAPTVLGVNGTVTLPSPDDDRAFILITSPGEGEQVSSPVDVDILGNVFEGNVNWQLLDDTGAKVDDGFVTTSMGEWTPATIHLGDLDPGTYTIRCLEFSAANGKPGNVDDKKFTVG
jgi:hypothetical protein